MAIHKQNNYTSPEVVTVDFKVEQGLNDSLRVGVKGESDFTDRHRTVTQGTEEYDDGSWEVYYKPRN